MVRNGFLLGQVKAILTPRRPLERSTITKNIGKSITIIFFFIFGRSEGPCDVFDLWVRWERGQVGI